MAEAHLKRSGATVLGRNLRAGRGEVDLLVSEAGTVVAVEVKTRIGEDPMVQITADKQRRMRQAALLLRPRPLRIDVIAVRLDPSGAEIRRVRAVA